MSAEEEGKDAQPVPPLVGDWLRSACRGSSGQTWARPVEQESEISR
jgi:hypothetical protein